MKKEASGDEAYFQEMLKVTSALRKEQEEEVRIHERVREQRHALGEAEQRFVESSRRLAGYVATSKYYFAGSLAAHSCCVCARLKSSGAQSQTAEQMLSKLQKSVRELVERKGNSAQHFRSTSLSSYRCLLCIDSLESSLSERGSLLEKLQGWDQNERMTTEDDVRAKRDQVRFSKEVFYCDSENIWTCGTFSQVNDMREQVSTLDQRLDAALEKNTKLTVFRQVRGRLRGFLQYFTVLTDVFRF
jgi:hypothetical protein